MPLWIEAKGGAYAMPARLVHSKYVAFFVVLF